MPRYPGGLIRKTPVTPTGPLQNGAASGVWSLADAAYWTKQGLWPLAGNTLAIEDVFSTWLYTGNGSTQTITNNINLSGSGGMVWTKNRGRGTSGNLIDTVRGVTKKVVPSSTAAQATVSYMTSFDTTGYTINGNNDEMNLSADTYASWTFREAPNFFDVVTWTGDGVAGRQIAHNLGVAPGMMIVKMTSAVEGWAVYHRGTSSPATKALFLNTTDAENAGSVGYWNSTAPTSTNFTLGSNYEVNNNGSTYVAYLYAHDTASTGLIQCGSFTTDGSGNVANQNLGWEPQWILLKTSSTTQGWILADNMRGWSYASTQGLFANTSGAEFSNTPIVIPTANGFVGQNGQLSPSQTYVYMAIRRGPMRTPTLGTSVFAPVAQTGGGTVTTNFPVDMAIYGTRSSGTNNHQVTDRLRGAPSWVTTNLTNAETQPLGAGVALLGINNSNVGYTDNVIGAAATAYWNFRRAPGFMDEVCYAGTGAARTLNHNLGVVPELIIVKSRSAVSGWPTYAAPLGIGNFLTLQSNAASTADPGNVIWNNVSPTSTTFSVGTNAAVNGSGDTFVAYLFASAPGVSKVGTYTGNGSSQTINCAFTTGARFVLIKRTDSTGGWLVWDSARGIVAGNDPYLALNSNAAEVTTDDSVDTDNTGFIVNQVAASNINVNAATYIFLAIA